MMFRKALQGILELLYAFPLLLVLIIYVLPPVGGWYWLALLPVLHLGGMLIRRWCESGGLGSYALIVESVVGMVCSVSVAIVFMSGWEWSVAAGVGLLVFFRGALLWNHSWSDIFPIPFAWLGVALYFVVGMFIQHMTDHVQLFQWLGLIMLLVTLFLLNRDTLMALVHPRKQVSKGRRSIPPFVHTYNIVFISMLILLVGTLIVLRPFVDVFGMIQQLWLFVWGWLPEFDGELWDWLPEIERNYEPSESGEAFAPIRFDWEYMHPLGYFGIAMLAIMVIGPICLIIYAAIKLRSELYQLFIGKWRQSVHWLRRVMFALRSIWHLLRGKAGENEQADAQAAIVDERTNLRMKREKNMESWVRRMIAAQPAWSELRSYREKVRYVYRMVVLHYMQRGFRFQRNYTPQETEQQITEFEAGTGAGNRPIQRGTDGRVMTKPDADLQALIEMYNRQRYGEMTSGDAETLDRLRRHLLGRGK